MDTLSGHLCREGEVEDEGGEGREGEGWGGRARSEGGERVRSGGERGEHTPILKYFQFQNVYLSQNSYMNINRELTVTADSCFQ